MNEEKIISLLRAGEEQGAEELLRQAEQQKQA